MKNIILTHFFALWTVIALATTPGGMDKAATGWYTSCIPGGEKPSSTLLLTHNS